jgi:hypothetical protein
MAIGYESAVVNGQLVNVAPGQAFDPLTFGQAYVGPARWPRQGVYAVPPVMPSTALQYSMAPATYGSDSSFPTATSETGNPYHLKKSPVIWAIVLFSIGILMLMHVHYR